MEPCRIKAVNDIGETIRVRRLSFYILVGLLSVSLMSCTHSRMTYLPDGRAGYAIACAHFYQNWSSCVTKAGRLCRSRGYTVSYSDEVNGQMIVGCKVATLDPK
jgi:hypothetical protein